MSFDLDKLKLQQFSDKLQVAIFDLSGNVIESCNSVLQIDTTQSIFDQFLFLKSLEEVFASMTVDEEQRFSEVEWQEGKKGLFHIIFKKVLDSSEAEVIQWTIIDNTFYYDKLLNLQQSRNDNAISEEFAQIRQRVIEAENELLEFKNSELERIQQFKADFFAKVSHEMRTPLNSITGLADLLQTKPQEQYLSALKSTSKHLNAIINDILDLSKIEAGKINFETTDFEICSLINTILDGFLFVGGKKGIELKSELPDTPVWLSGDPTRLSQIIYNLIGNAIKFTDSGFVRLSAGLTEFQNGIRLVFEVEDSGIGMSAEAITSVLEPYAQASDETNRIYGGTGLGLSIAKELIEAFGGELKIESSEGVGTKMSFSIDMKIGKQSESGEATSYDFSSKSVLLAEDDPVSAKVIQKQLQEAFMDCFLVEDGERLFEEASKETYDLIISDINLPVKDGLEVLNQLRKTGDKTPFLIISGESRPSEISNINSAEFLMKPIESRTLFSQISALFEAQTLKVDLSKLKSMIEDEAFVNDLLNTILETLPQELDRLLEAAKNNDEETIRKSLHKIKPSLDYLGVKNLVDLRLALMESCLTGKLELDMLTELDKSVRLALVDLRNQIKK